MNRLAGFCVLVLCAAALPAAPWQGFTALAVSNDGRWFVTGGHEGEVTLWELSTGEIQGRWKTVPLPVAGLAFSADGLSVGAVTLDGAVWTVDLSKAAIGQARAEDWPGLSGSAERALNNSAVLYGVGATWKNLEARGSPDGSVTVTSAGAPVTWQAHGAAVTALIFCPDGTLLSAGYDGTLSRWDPHTGRSLGRL